MSLVLKKDRYFSIENVNIPSVLLYFIGCKVNRITLNFYPDGSAGAGAHRHDCWTGNKKTKIKND